MQGRLIRGLVLLAALCAVVYAQAAMRFPPPPAPGVFLIDRAAMVHPTEAAQIHLLCRRLQEEQSTPIVVVTIGSLAAYGAGHNTIERYTLRLFNQWQLGTSQRHGAEWNTGMLLLVSRDDQRVRIQLGAGWEAGKIARCKRIVNETILPAIQRKAYSAGILHGVQALDTLARERAQPVENTPTGLTALPVMDDDLPFPLILLLAAGIVLFVYLLRLSARLGMSGSLSDRLHREFPREGALPRGIVAAPLTAESPAASGAADSVDSEHRSR